MIDSFAYHFFNFYISDRMAENIKEELGMEEIEIKENFFSFSGNMYWGCAGRRCSDGKCRN